MREKEPLSAYTAFPRSQGSWRMGNCPARGYQAPACSSLRPSPHLAPQPAVLLSLPRGCQARPQPAGAPRAYQAAAARVRHMVRAGRERERPGSRRSAAGPRARAAAAASGHRGPRGAPRRKPRLTAPRFRARRRQRREGLEGTPRGLVGPRGESGNAGSVTLGWRIPYRDRGPSHLAHGSPHRAYGSLTPGLRIPAPRAWFPHTGVLYPPHRALCPSHTLCPRLPPGPPGQGRRGG